MFSGIIQYKERILALKKDKDNLSVSIKKPSRMKIKIGDSINIDGVCSTVVKISKNSFIVQYMSETINLVKPLKNNSAVNLETSLTLKDVLGGHLISGHIDTTGLIRKINDKKGSKEYFIEYPRKFRDYLIYKGSVAINGVSLTVSEIKNNLFRVSLIPYTLKNTNFGNLKVNDKVNIEFDLFAKYIKQCLKK
jgi:riboflavin synthase